MQTEAKYWFPAKRYGWGWGPPSSWQGWAVIGVFVVLVSVGVFAFPPVRNTGAFVAFVVVLNVLLVAVCWLKGEPPRWRWGKDDRDA
jgi:hypothetical protein